MNSVVDWLAWCLLGSSWGLFGSTWGRLGTLLLVLPKHPPEQGLVVADEGGDGVVGVAGARPCADQLVQPLGAGKVLEMISQ